MTLVLKAAGPRMLAIGELSEPLELRESPRASRLSLRVDAGRGLIQVVVPLGVGEAEAIRFVGRHRAWIQRRLAGLPKRLPFLDGGTVPVLGIEHVIRHQPGRRSGVERREGELRVGGLIDHVARRIRDHLCREARSELSQRSVAKAAMIDARVTRVTVRDTRSRWGSCSSAGRLSFSWRLIMTPAPVLDYVVAHEVAHLREMNHSSRFWALVDTLTDEVPEARTWLKLHGAQLLRYG